MPDAIVCPVCGESNHTDTEFCQNCQSRLQPLSSPLVGENAPVQPGDLSAKKVTSELEPVLPKWLREARQLVEEDASGAGNAQQPAPVSQGSDLLAGLVALGKAEDEETPDWVASVIRTADKRKEPEREETQVNSVELGHGKEPAGAPSTENETVLPFSDPGKSSSAGDERGEWFKQDSEVSNGSATDQTGNDLPSQVGSESILASNGGDLDWLNKLEAESSVAVQGADQPAPAVDEESQDWAQKLADLTKLARENVAGDSYSSDQEIQASSLPSMKEEDSTTQPDLPTWLKNIGEDSRAMVESVSAVPDQTLPDWLKASSEHPALLAVKPLDNVPSEGEAAAEPRARIASSTPVEPQPHVPTKHAADTIHPREAPAESVPEISPPVVSALTTESMTGADVEAIFASLETPDWLSETTPSQPPSEASIDNFPPAAQKEVTIAPTELPSWIRAMRPEESAMPNSSTGITDTRLEEVGALAGLQGVLPVIPGVVGLTSTPKTHSVKLDSTDQQQTHAALLEKILAAESTPIPMTVTTTSSSQRALRWAISAVLFVVLGAVVLSRTQKFPLPNKVPDETLTAIRTVEAIPAGAPVLVVFDYEPSTVGEMEATAASLMDHLLLLKHPRLALLSTSPTGAALAERFISRTLSNRSYQRGVQYENLGYLPGGLAGVYDFAQNPVSVMPLGADSEAVWQSPVLRGVAHLTDFTAVIVLTDNVESGRVWIEQTASARGSAFIVMASSAQAGPVLLPYVDSGQLSGLVAGLNGAAGVEQANGGLPGYVRSYWDAYSVGLLLAAVLIFTGSIWSFWLGARDGRTQEPA